jgi:preprotein translocase subunit SecG
MIYLLTTLHVIACLFLIGVVLLQQGKSADLAGAFGGQGSQTAFGPRGAANLLTKLTAWSAIIFMITSISLFVLIGRRSSSHSVLEGTRTAPVHTSNPATPAPAKK